MRRFSAAMAVAVLASCTTPGGEQHEWLARVDGTEITVDAFQQRFAQVAKEVGELPVLSADAVGDLKTRVLTEMIDERLLLNAAAREGVEATQAEIDAAVAAMRRDIGDRDWRRFLLEHYVDDHAWHQAVRRRVTIAKLVDAHLGAASSVSEPAIRAYYEANADRFKRPRQVQLQQIVVDDESAAADLLQALRDGADFAALAREHSLGPEASRGGDLGLLVPDDLPQTFSPAFSLRAGQRSSVVKTEYGYHIFRVVAVEPPRTLTLDQVRGQIERQLLEQRRRVVRQELSDRLRAEATIEVQRDVWQRIRQP